MNRLLWFFLFLLLLAFVVYLSLRASPAIVSVPWFPERLAQWLDRHDFVKNLAGFGVLAYAGFAAFLPLAAPRTKDGPSDPVPMRRFRRKRLLVSLALIAGLGLLIVALELMQVGRPRRTCDPEDLVAGGLGIFVAWIAGAMRRNRRQSPEKEKEQGGHSSA